MSNLKKLVCIHVCIELFKISLNGTENGKKSWKSWMKSFSRNLRKFTIFLKILNIQASGYDRPNQLYL